MALERVELRSQTRRDRYLPMQALPAQRSHLVRSAIRLRGTRPKTKIGHGLARLTRMSNVFRFPRGDWTDEERAELSCLEEYCADKYVLECSQTDEGDPWCVVFLQGQHEILLHLAKLDSGYVAVSPRQSRSLRTRHFAEAIRFGRDVLASTAERVG
jgi:hypothetical protein